MIYALVTPTKRGIISLEQVQKFGCGIFPCGHCSCDDIKVFHNLLGQHVHFGAAANEYNWMLIRQAAK